MDLNLEYGHINHVIMFYYSKADRECHTLLMNHPKHEAKLYNKRKNSAIILYHIMELQEHQVGYSMRNIKDKNLMLPTIFDLCFAVLLINKQ